MTPAERRKARKAARANGETLTGELALPRDNATDRATFTETARGYRARDRWARRYYDRNGAPEDDGDR